MSVEGAMRALSARVIVVGNEKGGSGKSTVAMHIAIALIKSGQAVATIDLDTRQKSLTHHIENRRAWARHVGRDLGMPQHFCFQQLDYPSADEQAAGCRALEKTVETLAGRYGVVIIDTPGHDDYLTHVAHAMADTLITPLNDSFVDLDVLGSVDPESFRVTGTSHYAEMVEEARGRRRVRYLGVTDWIVLRNRLSTLGSRNKRLVGESIQQLSQRLNFRCIDGLAERVIFREFYPRGLTAVDDLDEITLGSRPTMSHVTARLEMLKLLTAIGLGNAVTAHEIVGRRREVA
ncbi:AAA family ATPase [Bradyrhizobium sp. AUGA SZCCT0240]|uniref:division plane positioning ATPase MipZ n=1 Tax=unclassified Bradyrhizobium TaxID=2631580 RepID=UPI001BAC87C3|nr:MULTISPECIES: division plane positioning ATPase MipZ [unclassified Bradyrhizobium]MBR1197905.1 AAA family ATPase [Bradyrhizobium sp. AUGA SZCCT0158]MBR1244171.1 AAA family ATPase [Bradyrhizobium sp. AUGA SZCCT0274]MBR1258066.1 AAA family ATPase [Bradyrhizobium sp. AUGA SZCCT0240]